MSRILLSPAAREDLKQIKDYIATGSIAAARRVVRELRQAMERLAAMPGSGHLCEGLGDEALRIWIVYSYLIVYRPQTRPLQVVRVVGGYRDLGSWFEPRG